MSGKRENFWSVVALSMRKARSAVVVMSGLFALMVIAIVALAMVAGDGQQVVTLASGAFGVVGAVIGAYFGVNASANARDAMRDVAMANTGAAAPAEGAEPGEADVDEAAVYGEAPPSDVGVDETLEAIDAPPLDDDELREIDEELVGIADEPDEDTGAVAGEPPVPSAGTAAGSGGSEEEGSR